MILWKFFEFWLLAKEAKMTQLFKKNVRVAALVAAFCFVSTLIASPAFSRNRRYHYPRHHHKSHHVRVFHDSDFLPALLATGIIAGITYSLIDSAANPPVHEYRVVDRTYVPVAPPSSYAPAAGTGSITVTAQLLNVRTGPSLNAPLMQQLPYGTVLSICDSSPGWYYVDLPGNRRGWVMARFTEPLGYAGDG